MTLVFSGPTIDPTRSRKVVPSSFRVTSGTQRVRITSVEVLSNGNVRLGFAAALDDPAAPLKVAYGAADWGVDHALYDTGALPVMSFFQVTIPTRR